ncbi:MAG: hypothetical protein OXH58_10285 [Acidimicrobiaceae bacterium]|nr:hypothetical protein [Acidimicrobiaceae bacterium]
MTASAPIPAAEATPAMAHSHDTAAEVLSEQAAPAHAPASAVRPRLRDQIAENPLLTLFGTVIVALLLFVLGTTNLRIGDTNDRIDRLEDRFASLEHRVIDIDLKLTALIAALNVTETVDAALEGRLLQSDADDRDPQPGRERPGG